MVTLKYAKKGILLIAILFFCNTKAVTVIIKVYLFLYLCVVFMFLCLFLST